MFNFCSMCLPNGTVRCSKNYVGGRRFRLNSQQLIVMFQGSMSLRNVMFQKHANCDLHEMQNALLNRKWVFFEVSVIFIAKGTWAIMNHVDYHSTVVLDLHSWMNRYKYCNLKYFGHFYNWCRLGTHMLYVKWCTVRFQATYVRI